MFYELDSRLHESWFLATGKDQLWQLAHPRFAGHGSSAAHGCISFAWSGQWVPETK